MTTTTRMGLSHLTGAQAQKHVTVNAAFDLIDVLWNLLVEDIALTAPPGGESEGQCWIVASPATGDWEGHEDAIAIFLNGGYEFKDPFDGLTAWFDDNRYTYFSGSWVANAGLTNLTFSRDATTVTVESDTGTDAVLPVATASLAGAMSAADKAALDALLAAYLPPVQDTTALTALAEADLTDKIRIFVEDDNAIYHYDAEAVAGDESPDDQTGGTGYWILLAAVGGGGVSDGDKGDIVVSSSGVVWTIDAEFLRSDETATITVGYIQAVHDAGTKASGSFQPDIADGAKQKCVNGGAFTLTPPGVSCDIKLKVTNNASAGVITTTDFSIVTGDALTTTDGDKFELYISDWGDGDDSLHVKALQ